MTSSQTQTHLVQSRRSLLKAGTLALGLAASSLAMGIPHIEAQETIRFGALPSATGPGGAIGAALTIGVDIAVAEINAAGGVLGKQIEIVRGDTQSNPTTAAGETRRLIERESIDILFGPLYSQEAVPSVEVATQAKMVQITNAGTAVLTPEVGPYHFSFNTSAETAAKVMVDYVADHFGAKTVAILGDNGGQSKSGVAAVKKILEERGIKLVAEQEYRFRAEDLSPQILSLRRAEPEAVIFFTSIVEDGALMLSTLAQIGWQPKVVGATAMSVYAPAIERSVGPEAFENVYSVAYKGMTYCSTDAAGSSPYAQFSRALEAFAPEQAGKVSISLASEYYDAVKLLVAGIVATGGTDGPTLAKWIETEGSKVPLIHGAISPSGASHFLFGPNELAIVHRPNATRADGLMKRAGC